MILGIPAEGSSGHPPLPGLERVEPVLFRVSGNATLMPQLTAPNLSFKGAQGMLVGTAPVVFQDGVRALCQAPHPGRFPDFAGLQQLHPADGQTLQQQVQSQPLRWGRPRGVNDGARQCQGPGRA